MRNNFAKIATASLIVFALTFAAWLNFAPRNSQNANAAAGNYEITDVGEISTFEISDSDGALSSSNGVNFSSQIVVSTITIAGTIHGTENLAAGDKITLTVASASGSTYFLSSIAALDATIKNSVGATQFNIGAIYSNQNLTLTLTKTAAELSGDFNFSINAERPFFNMILANYPSSSTTLTLADKNITFPNSAKTQSVANYFDQQIGYNTFGNAAAIAPGMMNIRIYTYLLQHPDATAADLENVFGADVLRTNLIQVATLTPTSGSHIISVSGANGTPRHTTYALDILDDRSGLNNSFSAYVSANNWTDRAVTLTPNSTFEQISAQIANPHDYGFVKNSDGTWTIAINQGPILGGLNYYAANVNANANNMPNTAENNAVNSDLIARARAMQLMPERFWQEMIVTFSDSTLKESANYVVKSNLFADRSGTIGDAPISNSATGQTAVKAHYVDLRNNPIGETSASYGWPADNAAGETPTAPVTVRPRDFIAATPQKYALIIDSSVLTDFANRENIDRAKILTTDENVAFPLTNEQNVDVYYVYAPIYDVKFDVNCEENCSAAPNDEAIIQTGDELAMAPAPPARAHYSFAGWFTTEDFQDGTEFDFAKPVVADVTLYAKWTEDAKCEFNPTLYFDDETCKPQCEYNPEIFSDDKDCQPECEWDSEILMNDERCVKPEELKPNKPTEPTEPIKPNETETAILGAPNTAKTSNNSIITDDGLRFSREVLRKFAKLFILIPL